MGELVAVLGMTPSLPSTPFPHNMLQWVALWAQSTAPHIRSGVRTGCWGRWSITPLCQGRCVCVRLHACACCECMAIGGLL